MALNPLHQFEVTAIHPLMLGGLDITITNQTLWTGIATASVLLLFILGTLRMAMVPGRMQAFVEITFEFIQKLTEKTAGREAMVFFPLIMTYVFIYCRAELDWDDTHQLYGHQPDYHHRVYGDICVYFSGDRGRV